MTLLRELRFSTPLDPRPLAGLRFGAAPPLLTVQPGAVPVVGAVILPIPGPPGQPGLDGSVAATLPWSNITDKPADLTRAADLAAVRQELLALQSYVQPFTNASVIVVQHNLGRFPAVTVLDSAGSEWETQVTHDSLYQLTVYMAFTFSGRVACT